MELFLVLMAIKLLAAQVSIPYKIELGLLILMTVPLYGMSLLQNKPTVDLMSCLKVLMGHLKKVITIYGQQILLVCLLPLEVAG